MFISNGGFWVPKETFGCKWSEGGRKCGVLWGCEWSVKAGTWPLGVVTCRLRGLAMECGEGMMLGNWDIDCVKGPLYWPRTGVLQFRHYIKSDIVCRPQITCTYTLNHTKRVYAILSKIRFQKKTQNGILNKTTLNAPVLLVCGVGLGRGGNKGGMWFIENCFNNTTWFLGEGVNGTAVNEKHKIIKYYI